MVPTNRLTVPRGKSRIGVERDDITNVLQRMHRPAREFP